MPSNTPAPQVGVVASITPSPISPAVPADGDSAVSPGAYVNVTPVELALMLEEKDFMLINTHAPYGYEIESTDAHIPVDPAGRWLERYPQDRATKIVLYCRSARWSAIAARGLADAGYTNLWHLEGGMRAWHAAGLPLVGN